MLKTLTLDQKNTNFYMDIMHIPRFLDLKPCPTLAKSSVPGLMELWVEVSQGAQVRQRPFSPPGCQEVQEQQEALHAKPLADDGL